jgi:predicted Zn finger-like uncharacterized protein
MPDTAETDTNDEKIELLCKGCGGAFLTFLHQMAAHNGQVTCPQCGNVHEYSAAEVQNARRLNDSA